MTVDVDGDRALRVFQTFSVDAAAPDKSDEAPHMPLYFMAPAAREMGFYPTRAVLRAHARRVCDGAARGRRESLTFTDFMHLCEELAVTHEDLGAEEIRGHVRALDDGSGSFSCAELRLLLAAANPDITVGEVDAIIDLLDPHGTDAVALGRLEAVLLRRGQLEESTSRRRRRSRPHRRHGEEEGEAEGEVPVEEREQSRVRPSGEKGSRRRRRRRSQGDDAPSPPPRPVQDRPAAAAASPSPSLSQPRTSRVPAADGDDKYDDDDDDDDDRVFERTDHSEAFDAVEKPAARVPSDDEDDVAPWPQPSVPQPTPPPETLRGRNGYRKEPTDTTIHVDPSSRPSARERLHGRSVPSTAPVTVSDGRAMEPPHEPAAYSDSEGLAPSTPKTADKDKDDAAADHDYAGDHDHVHSVGGVTPAAAEEEPAAPVAPVPKKKDDSKNLSNYASQAVKGLRRLVGGGDGLTATQQDLVSFSREVEERWQQRRQPVDVGTVEMWCAGLHDELTFLISRASSPDGASGVGGGGGGNDNGTGSAQPRNPLPESAMLNALETARIISRTGGRVAAESFAAHRIVPLLVSYYMTVPLSRRVRESCALALSEVPGDQPPLMHGFLRACLPHIIPPLPEEGEEGEEEAEAVPLVVRPLAVSLAAILIGAIHRADAVCAAEGEPRFSYPAADAVAVLRAADALLRAPSVTAGSSTSGSPSYPTGGGGLGHAASSSRLDSAVGETSPRADGDGGEDGDAHRLAVLTVFLGLLAGLLRSNSGLKRRVIGDYAAVLVRTWTAAASSLSRAGVVLSIPTASRSRRELVPVGTAQLWQSELLELLVELVTDDSFTLRRLSAYDAPGAAAAANVTFGGGDEQGSSLPPPFGDSAALPLSPDTAVGFGVRRFEPIPPHWDTLLTGGSPLVWHMASHLSVCRVQPEAVGVLEHCLMGIDTGASVFAEGLYRNLVSTLMLLCAADPINAQRLANNGMFETLVALVTFRQPSVFSSSVAVPRPTGASSRNGGSGEGEAEGAFDSVSPTAVLTTNTTQLTEAFMSALAATCFPRKLVELLMGAVESMPRGRSCQTDADIVEALLHVLSTTYTPPRTLFFPGSGSVVCKVDGFPGRWSGYSFAAWVNPMCVWSEGSHLFSFTEDSGASVALSIVANGRSCCLALRVRTSKELAVLVLPESSMAAEAWSHVVLTQGLTGLAVFVNGRRLPTPSVSVPFPQAASKRHRLDLALGGALGEPSFYGHVASMDLFEDAIGEKDVGRLYARGPGGSEAAGFRPVLCISAPPPPDVAAAVSSVEPPPVSITGSLLGSRDGVSMHNVSAVLTPDMQAVFAECGAMAWALRTLKASHGAANFHVVAKLCISFISAAMRMTNSDAELNAVLLAGSRISISRSSCGGGGGGGGGNGNTRSPWGSTSTSAPPPLPSLASSQSPTAPATAPTAAVLMPYSPAFMDALTEEVLSWGDTFMDFPSIMLATAASSRGSSTRVLRDHPSTQAIFSMLLSRLEVVSGFRNGTPTSTRATSAAHSRRGSPNSGAAAFLVSRNALSACTILRELSDCLLVDRNVGLFRADSRRFERVLEMSLHLPRECVETVVVLLEKLCKSGPELERTLRFLLLPPPAPALVPVPAAASPLASLSASSLLSESQTSLQSAAAVPNSEVAKAEILHMLFDVARADAGMCELIGASFKGAGASFLIMLINGKNHASEAIRVFALRLLSLLLHSNRKFRDWFIRVNGFEVLSRAITDPASRVPIRLPTVDCLFQMAFDVYRPAAAGAGDAAMAATATVLSPTTKGKAAKRAARYAGAATRGGAGGGAIGSGGLGLGLSGHLPGLVSRRLKVARREYSFEVAHDFARADDRLQLDEAYRAQGGAGTLHVPAAFETALAVLGCLIRSCCCGGGGFAQQQQQQQDGAVVSPSLLSRGESLQGIEGGGGGGTSAAGKSQPPDEEAPEVVVGRVLSYLEKVTDVAQNGVALLQYPWMEWLWAAVEAVAVARKGLAAASPLTPTPKLRFTKNFPATVMTHTRHIIQKLVVLDMTRNSKAASIRRLRGIRQPPYLLRIVLEEVVRHFSKWRQEEMADPRGASNAIKNLDALFHGIEHALDPLPVVLGTEIVGSISTIAVRNNSWVRMRMKRDSNLFETRDRLAFFLLVSIKCFASADAETLVQLADANANGLGAACVLLHRLTRAVDSKDVDEVEALLLLLRHLATVYEDQLREVYRLLGEGGAQLAELLCSAREEAAAATPSSRQTTTDSFAHGTNSSGGAGAGGPAPPRGATTADATLDGADPLPDGAAPVAPHSPANRLPTLQVIEWSRAHSAQWAAVADDCRGRVAKLIESHAKGGRDRAEKEQAVVAKATRSHAEHREQLDLKVRQELARIRGEVDAELSARPARAAA